MDIQRPASKMPIPPSAKCVFKGTIFDVYQWEQRMFDGSTATFEKLKRPDTVAVVATTSDKKIIITHEEQPGTEPFISLPGGRIDKEDSDPEEAVMRELKEETGYECESIDLWYAYQPLPKIDWAVFVFVAKNCKKVADTKLDIGEKINVDLITFEQLLELSESDKFRSDELSIRLLRAKNNPEKLEELKKLFFGE